MSNKQRNGSPMVQVERKPQLADAKPALQVKYKGVAVRKLAPGLRGWQAFTISVDLEGHVTEVALAPMETSLDAERRAANELHHQALPPRQGLDGLVRHG